MEINSHKIEYSKLLIEKYLLIIKLILNENNNFKHNYIINLLIEFLRVNNIDEFLVKYDCFIIELKKKKFNQLITTTYKLRQNVKELLKLDCS